MQTVDDLCWVERLPRGLRRDVQELLDGLNVDATRDFSAAPIARFMRETTSRQRNDLIRAKLALPPRKRIPGPRVRGTKRPLPPERQINWRASRWAPASHTGRL